MELIELYTFLDFLDLLQAKSNNKVGKFISYITGKTEKEIENNKKRHKAKIHYNTVIHWIESTKILNDERIDFLNTQIDRFEKSCFDIHVYGTPKIVEDHNEYENLINNLRSKLKQAIRKGYLKIIVKILAEKSYMSKKMNFKAETGVDDDTFKNIFITHTTGDKLRIEYISHNPMNNKKLEFDFPYLANNLNIPDVYKLEDIFENIIYSFKINVEYKVLELL